MTRFAEVSAAVSEKTPNIQEQFYEKGVAKRSRALVSSPPRYHVVAWKVRFTPCGFEMSRIIQLLLLCTYKAPPLLTPSALLVRRNLHLSLCILIGQPYAQAHHEPANEALGPDLGNNWSKNSRIYQARARVLACYIAAGDFHQ